MTDIQSLRDILAVTKDYLRANQNHLDKAGEVLFAVVEQSLSKVKEGISIEDINFTYLEMYSFVWGNNAESDKARKTISGYREKITQFLNPDSDLSIYLVKNGFKNTLQLASNDSKGGAKAFWYLTLTGNNAESFSPSNKISYKPIAIQKPYFWVRPLLKVSLRGKGAFFFVCIPVIAVIGIPFLIYLLGTTNYIWVAIVSAFVLYFFARAIFVIYELMEKGVSSVPDFMVRLKTSNIFFVVTRDKGTKGEKKPKLIEIVQYEASCPKCGDIVFIEHGIKEFKGRYVGCCTLAPSEHLFSFDHITKKGNCLR